MLDNKDYSLFKKIVNLAICLILEYPWLKHDLPSPESFGLD